jgi:4'-phosphopantetheinyl transferase EntD
MADNMLTTCSETPLRASVLLSMLGAEFAVAVAVPKRVNDQLFPDELLHIARAVEKRQAEFGTARVCARRALAQLGIAPCPLVPNADRSPRWPSGITGSISHTHGCCAVAVTNSPHVAGVGLDLELDVPLYPELERMICRPSERLWLDDCDREKRGWLGKLFFSAKEAFYKCQYQTTRTLLDFRDVELDIDLESGRFSAVEITRHGAQWDLVRHAIGKFRCEPGLIVTTAVLNPEEQ